MACMSRHSGAPTPGLLKTPDARRAYDMNAEDLTRAVMEAPPTAPVVGIAADGRTYQIKAVASEVHEDGDDSTTVWLMLVEN